jgi:hypothetical protein
LAAVGVKPEVVLRKTEYVTPDVVLAVQLRLIWLDDTAVGVRLVGAAGMTGAGALTVSVNVAVPICPVELVAVNVIGKLPVTVGVPEMTAPVRFRPVGRELVLKVVPAWLEVMV